MAGASSSQAGGGRPDDAPYSVSMPDAETARALFREGGTLLFLNVPIGTLVGLDGQVFTVGPNFMGVKMIPPGVHLFTTQAVQSASRHDDSGDGRRRQQDAAPPPAAANAAAAAPALAEFVDLAPRSVLVRGWDARAEALAPLADEDEEARFAAGARRGDFDRGLAPYDLGAVRGGGGCGGGGGAATTTTTTAGIATSGWARWRALAGLITPALARRLMPPPLRLPDGRECAAPLSVTAEAAEEEAAGGGGRQRAAAAPSAAERRLDAQLAEGRRRQQQQEEDNEQPQPGALAVALSSPPSPPSPSSPSSSRLAAVALAAAPEPSRARYTPVERLSKLAGLSAAQLTEANMDRSTAAETLLMAVVAREEQGGGAQAATNGATARATTAPSSAPPPLPLPLARLLRVGGPLLLGELQFAFAAFAAGGQSLEGLHQWRSIACLLLACERLPFAHAGGDGEGVRASAAAAAAAAASAFFAAFLRILAAQLRYALGVGPGQGQGGGGDGPAPLLVDDDLLRQSFLGQGVRRFLSALRAAERRQRGGDKQQQQQQDAAIVPPSPGSLSEVRAAAALVVSALREGLGWEGMDAGGGGGEGGGAAAAAEGGEDGGDDDDDDDDEGPTVVDLDEGYVF